MASTSEIFEKIQEALTSNPGKTGGLQAVYQFDLTGDDGGVYQMALTSEGTTVSKDGSLTPDCTLSLTAGHFKDMVAGKLNGVSAFMTGKLRVEGNIGLAMKLQTLLSAYSE